LFCALNPLRGQDYIPLSIEALTQNADLVVLGSVESKTVQKDKEGRIFTDVELRVSEVWKGAWQGKDLHLVMGGGVLGVERSYISGQVEYGISEEVAVFLVANPRGQWVTLGMAQGKFHVASDKASADPTVHNIFNGCTDEIARTVVNTNSTATTLRAQSATPILPYPLKLSSLKSSVTIAARKQPSPSK
jgi:hypothetical protein